VVRIFVENFQNLAIFHAIMLY